MSEQQRLEQEVNRIIPILVPYFGLSNTPGEFEVKIERMEGYEEGQLGSVRRPHGEKKNFTIFYFREGVSDYTVAHEVGHYLHFIVNPGALNNLSYRKGYKILETVAVKSSLIYCYNQEPFLGDPRPEFKLSKLSRLKFDPFPRDSIYIRGEITFNQVDEYCNELIELEHLRGRSGKIELTKLETSKK